MNMRIFIIACLACCAAAVAGCGSDGSSESNTKRDTIEVVAAFYPLAWLAERVGGEGVEVRNLTAAGAEPHDMELTPRDVAQLRSADVVLYVGEGFQPAVEEALAGADVTAIDVLQAPDLALLQGSKDSHKHDEHAEGDEHVEGDEHSDATAVDPHVWLDPVRFASIARYIARPLKGDAGAVVADLERLDVQYRTALAQCARDELFTSHTAFSYLADRYSLRQVAISGLSPESEPRPRDLERVARQARDAGATTIFFESLVSPKLSRQVAQEVGAETAVLDPLEGIAQERLDSGIDYLRVMRDNLARLRSSLGCSPR
jgi:zinc transport system substrate-binding protein